MAGLVSYPLGTNNEYRHGVYALPLNKGCTLYTHARSRLCFGGYCGECCFYGEVFDVDIITGFLIPCNLPNVYILIVHLCDLQWHDLMNEGEKFIRDHNCGVVSGTAFSLEDHLLNVREICVYPCAMLWVCRGLKRNLVVRYWQTDPCVGLQVYLSIISGDVVHSVATLVVIPLVVVALLK